MDKEQLKAQIKRQLAMGRDPKEIAKRYNVRVDLVRNLMVKKKKKQKIQRCLRCDNLFLSHGPGNRICSICKRTSKEFDTDEWNVF